MNNLLHIIGWKHQGKWDTDEITIDIFVTTVLVTGGVFIAYIYYA